MPAPQEMLLDLDAAGYRPITIRSFNEFIAGVRYVSIETSNGVTAFQFLPQRDISWSYVTWSDDSAYYRASAKRSRLEGICLSAFGPGLTWFAKYSELVELAGPYINRDAAGKAVGEGSVWMSFTTFITRENGLYESPYETKQDFDARHPASENSRLAVDLRRQKAELEAREAAIKQKENFAEADELKLIGAQFASRGNTAEANRYFRAAEDLRRDIQNDLDARRPVVRRNPVIQGPGFGEFDEEEDVPRAPRRAKKTLVVAQKGKRSIILGEDD